MSLTHRDVATVGIGGPVGSGKTSLISELVPRLRDRGVDVGVIANAAKMFVYYGHERAWDGVDWGRG